MAELREIRREDVLALVGLWVHVFGDPEAYVEEFFRLLPEIGRGVAAFDKGRLLGAAYMLTGQQLLADGKAQRCGYLYAVAVQPEARGAGIGAALSQAAAALGRADGCALIATRPAEPGLFAWYERTLGLRCGLYRRQRLLTSRAGLPVEALSPAEYGRRREALLRGRPHLRLEAASLQLEQANCAAFGGGLFALGEGLAAAYIGEDGSTEIRELLGAPDEDAAAVGAALQTPCVRLWKSGAAGEPYLALSGAALPGDTVWNLAFD